MEILIPPPYSTIFFKKQKIVIFWGGNYERITIIEKISMAFRAFSAGLCVT
jgi:hypothetical protein